MIEKHWIVLPKKLLSYWWFTLNNDTMLTFDCYWTLDSKSRFWTILWKETWNLFFDFCIFANNQQITIQREFWISMKLTQLLDKKVCLKYENKKCYKLHFPCKKSNLKYSIKFKCFQIWRFQLLLFVH